VLPKEKKEKEQEKRTPRGMRVRDGEGDRCSEASTTCISPIAASAVVQHSGGGGIRC
jgi:hypothetical protein